MTERRQLQFIVFGILLAAAAALVVGHDGGRVLGLADASFARLAQGLAVLLVVSSILVVGGAGLRRHAMAAAVWFVIGFALVVGYGLRGEITDAGDRLLGVLMPGRVVPVGDSVVVTRRTGQPFVLETAVNGAEVRMLLDTGASATTLSAEDAAHAGIKVHQLDFDETVLTANGAAQVATIMLASIAIGPIRLHDVEAFVTAPGTLDTSLLGMNALERLSSIQFSGDELVLTP